MSNKIKKVLFNPENKFSMEKGYVESLFFGSKKVSFWINLTILSIFSKIIHCKMRSHFKVSFYLLQKGTSRTHKSVTKVLTIVVYNTSNVQIKLTLFGVPPPKIVPFCKTTRSFVVYWHTENRIKPSTLFVLRYCDFSLKCLHYLFCWPTKLYLMWNPECSAEL